MVHHLLNLIEHLIAVIFVVKHRIWVTTAFADQATHNKALRKPRRENSNVSNLLVFDFEGTDPQSDSSINMLLNEEMFKTDSARLYSYITPM